jgi:hypothetical protein
MKKKGECIMVEINWLTERYYVEFGGYEYLGG